MNFLKSLVFQVIINYIPTGFLPVQIVTLCNLEIILIMRRINIILIKLCLWSTMWYIIFVFFLTFFETMLSEYVPGNFHSIDGGLNKLGSVKWGLTAILIANWMKDNSTVVIFSQQKITLIGASTHLVHNHHAYWCILSRDRKCCIILK